MSKIPKEIFVPDYISLQKVGESRITIAPYKINKTDFKYLIEEHVNTLIADKDKTIQSLESRIRVLETFLPETENSVKKPYSIADIIQPIERFRMIGYMGGILFTSKTTMGIYEEMKNPDSKILDAEYIECIVDDIKVPSTDFFEAFQEGECPEDLQFF